MTLSKTDILYLIYDGECILCKNTALVFRMKKSVGRLEIINARDAGPLVEEARQKRI
jgi:predicted DCC family thiol-disulfide oxidoreductase YuxK